MLGSERIFLRHEPFCGFQYALPLLQLMVAYARGDLPIQFFCRDGPSLKRGFLSRSVA